MTTKKPDPDLFRAGTVKMRMEPIQETAPVIIKAGFRVVFEEDVDIQIPMRLADSSGATPERAVLSVTTGLGNTYEATYKNGELHHVPAYLGIGWFNCKVAAFRADVGASSIMIPTRPHGTGRTGRNKK